MEVSLTKDILVIDVGANKGEFSKHVLKSNFQAKVIAIEPNQQFCGTDLNIVKDTFPNRVQIETNAIAKNSGKSFFHGSNLINGQLGSLLELNKNSIGWKLHKNFIDFNDAKSIKVDKISVKNFVQKYNLKNIDLLKIDIQGMDLIILNEFFKYCSIAAGIVEVDVGNLGHESRYSHSKNDINLLTTILKKNKFLITRIVPNNSSVDEFNIFYAKSQNTYDRLFDQLNLKNNPALSRYSVIQDAYISADTRDLILIKRLFEKILTGLLHPRASIRSLLLKITR
jgi:FkbM family methyltransferase